ncbi:DUF2332 domain-containing protein [Agrococcus sp. SGAir0287]|uniref:DUF2332 domain-containing protein n=1 Tax=Agrococcus sp. SGAir0287 TaxID=2070347 RepID=UPI001586AC69|nr:DUF2332 domain-containing protein [Agrococcus sp. SGAir0287]
MEDETAESAVAARWLRFAEVEGDLRSPRYADWARGLAADDALLARLAPLTRIEQQPNLVLSAMRFAGVDPLLPWREAQAVVHERWDAIEACVRSRRTQTNEARRLATLLPAFASLPQPIAIVEVGASMGLCLQPTHWSYAFATSAGERLVGDPSASRLTTRLAGGAEPRMPDVTWSAGLDLHPLSAASDDDVRWLETLIWPVGDGEPDRGRLERLHAAVAIAREHGPVVHEGDLVHDTSTLVEAARGRAATTVVFHTAVLAYVDAAGREAFARTMRDGDAVWISNEGLGVLPAVREQLDALDARPDAADFCVAIDEHPFALADAHGRWVRVLER